MSLIDNKTILIIGLGMIGGSIARGLKKSNPAQQIFAVDSDQSQIAEALAQKVIERGSTDLSELVPLADVIVLAVPTLAIAKLMGAVGNLMNDAAVLTDAGSVKVNVVEAAKEALGVKLNRFVPSHPIAGSEKSGFVASQADLFEGRNIIVTPSSTADADAVNLVNSLWRSMGAEILGMSVDQHDKVLAATSHLPHLLSYALVDVLINSDQCEDVFRYAAGGFADFSRLSSSDPTMWADIFVANSAATTEVLDDYIKNLQAFREFLISEDYSSMRSIFSSAKTARDNFIQKIFSPMDHNRMQENTQLNYQVNPGGSVTGEIRVPGDKSISHRAIIFGSLANGVTKVRGFLEGEDALNTLEAFREMGVTIVGPTNGELTIHGVGVRGLQAPRKPLYMGNSGTAMRLLTGLLAAQKFSSELTGDDSLSLRPMRRVADPLSTMGAAIETTDQGTPPLKITGADLQAIDYEMPMASAQVKSSILLGAMYASGTSCIKEPAVCRDHTERMLKGFGYPVSSNADTGEVAIEGGHELTATDIDVPSDISSAAFFLVAAAITPDSNLRLKHVGVNPTRTGIIDILQLMGANITLENQCEIGGEPVADLLIQYSPLSGIEIPQSLIPLAIDEFPVLFVAAACAEGVTRLRGAEELRVKESDRLQAMADGLNVLGVDNELFEDGIDITGGSIGSGDVDSEGDHRIAMAFTIAGLRANGAINIKNCSNVATSFPGFLSLANQVGIDVSSQSLDSAESD